MTSIVGILIQHETEPWDFMLGLVHMLAARNNKVSIDDLYGFLDDDVIDAFAHELFERGYVEGSGGFWNYCNPLAHPTAVVDQYDLSFTQVVEREIVPF